MGKRSPSPPPAPDPVATSNAQAAANRETAITQAGLNMVNQRTPYGSLEYRQIGTWQDGTPRYEATQYQRPEVSTLADLDLMGGLIAGGTAVNQIARVSDRLSTPFDVNSIGPARVDSVSTGGLPALQSGASASRPVTYDAGQRDTLDFTGLGDPNISRDRVETALFDRMNPQMERDRAALEQRLANQGISYGSQAWQAAQDDLNRGRNDARLGVIANAGQEQSRLFGLGLNQAQFGNDARFTNASFGNNAQAQEFGQSFSNAQLANAARAQGFNENLSSANFTNAARGQAINEAVLNRQQPLNEFSALMSGTQVQAPQFVNTPGTQVAPTDVAGPVYQNYQGALNAYNQQVGSRNSMMGGLFGLGGAALGGWARSGFTMPSDIRLKTDIERVGTLDNGLPVYAYRYKAGGPMQIGVMAQDVEVVNPAAVVEVDGFKHVDYAEAVR